MVLVFKRGVFSKVLAFPAVILSFSRSAACYMIGRQPYYDLFFAPESSSSPAPGYFKYGRIVLALQPLPARAVGLYFVPKPIHNALFIYVGVCIRRTSR